MPTAVYLGATNSPPPRVVLRAVEDHPPRVRESLPLARGGTFHGGAPARAETLHDAPIPAETPGSGALPRLSWAARQGSGFARDCRVTRPGARFAGQDGAPHANLGANGKPWRVKHTPRAQHAGPRDLARCWRAMHLRDAVIASPRRQIPPTAPPPCCAGFSRPARPAPHPNPQQPPYARAPARLASNAAPAELVPRLITDAAMIAAASVAVITWAGSPSATIAAGTPS